MGFNEELQALVDEVANRVDRWTGHSTWTFETGSSASAEVANTEIRADGTSWGDRPVRTSCQYAQMATKMAVELSRCAALLIGAGRAAPGIEAGTRASLEAGSVAWWLLEPGLTARQRVCRMQLLRRNGAREYAKSISEVGEDLAVAGKETVAGIEAECRDLGLAPFTQNGNELEGQARLGYTARVKALTDDLGNQGAYSIYSGVAHAELAGLWRLFGETGTTLPGREPVYGPAANPQASFAAADGTLKSMMGPVERIALLFGWTVPGRGDEMSATIDYINTELKRLHP
jgi:phage host-nuclease inhibitor protein Gam